MSRLSGLDVDSQVGIGSTFAFELPLHIGAGGQPALDPSTAPPEASAQPAGAGAPQERAAEGTRGFVLYVEDNPVNAVLMEAIIGLRPGVTLKVAPTGAAALQLLESFVPDLLLLDMHLPDMLGSDLLGEIRRRFPQRITAAVAVSAAARSDDVTRALARGFAAYWTKPLDIDRTLTELDRWLAA